MKKKIITKLYTMPKHTIFLNPTEHSINNCYKLVDSNITLKIAIDRYVRLLINKTKLRPVTSDTIC